MSSQVVLGKNSNMRNIYLSRNYCYNSEDCLRAAVQTTQQLTSWGLISCPSGWFQVLPEKPKKLQFKL